MLCCLAKKSDEDDTGESISVRGCRVTGSPRQWRRSKAFAYTALTLCHLNPYKCKKFPGRPADTPRFACSKDAGFAPGLLSHIFGYVVDEGDYTGRLHFLD